MAKRFDEMNNMNEGMDSLSKTFDSALNGFKIKNIWPNLNKFITKNIWPNLNGFVIKNIRPNLNGFIIENVWLRLRAYTFYLTPMIQNDHISMYVAVKSDPPSSGAPTLY